MSLADQDRSSPMLPCAQDPVARRLSFSMCTNADAEDVGSHDIETGWDDSILNQAFIDFGDDAGEGDDAESLDPAVSSDASTQCGLCSDDDDELDPPKPASDKNAENDLDEGEKDRERSCNFEVSDSKHSSDEEEGTTVAAGSSCQDRASSSQLGQELKASYSACLLSGETVLELQGSDTVFSARLMIASALHIGVQYVQVFSCTLGSLNDNGVLSELLAGSDDRSVSVVVLEDTRKKQKLNKAGAFITLGQYCQARELLESIGAVSEAKSLLETALERIGSWQAFPADPRLAKIQHELDRLSTNPYSR